MPPSVRILYLVGFTDWWGRYPPDVLDRDDAGTVGGGEYAALMTAFWLAGSGHDVVYSSVAEEGSHRGVAFTPLDRHVRTYLSCGPWDAVVAWGDRRLLGVVRCGALRVFAQQLNDLFGLGDDISLGMDLLISPSASHARMMRHLLGQDSPVGQAVVHNGVDLSMYPSEDLPDPSLRPVVAGWWSSPDRGLHHLLAAWPLVRRRVPAARLRIFYQVRKYIAAARDAGGRAGVLSHLLETRLAAVRHLGVDVVDAIPRSRLRREQAAIRVQAYPCEAEGYTEGFACSVAEAMAAGCLPLIRPVDALRDLWMPPALDVSAGVDPPGSDFVEAVADRISWGLTGWAEDPGRSPSVPDLRAHAAKYTWDAAGEGMGRTLADAVARRLAAAA